MKKTLVLLGSAALLLGAGCRVYEGDAATKKIGGIEKRKGEGRDEALSRADLIRTRVNNAAPQREDRVAGYLERRADVSDAKLERQGRKVAQLREHARLLGTSPRDHQLTDVSADMSVQGVVAKVLGDEVHVRADDGRDFVLKAATNSHVVADNRDIAASSLPVGFPVKATYGSVDGANYYYSVEALVDQ